MSEQLSEQCRQRKLEAVRVPPRHRGPKPSEQEIRAALEGRTIYRAAALLGYSWQGLRYVMAGYGMETGRRLSQDDIRLIVVLIDEGLSRADVADKFDVTEETVSAHYHRVKGTCLPTARNKRKAIK